MNKKKTRSSTTRIIIILTAVVLAFIVILAGPSIYRSIKRNLFKGQTEAAVLNIVEKKAELSNYSGAGVRTIGYDINYKYMVNGKSYTSTQATKPNSDVKLLFDNFSSGKECIIEIKYSIKTPENSLISKLLNNKH